MKFNRLIFPAPSPANYNEDRLVGELIYVPKDFNECPYKYIEKDSRRNKGQLLGGQRRSSFQKLLSPRGLNILRDINNTTNERLISGAEGPISQSVTRPKRTSNPLSEDEDDFFIEESTEDAAIVAKNKQMLKMNVASSKLPPSAAYLKNGMKTASRDRMDSSGPPRKAKTKIESSYMTVSGAGNKPVKPHPHLTIEA